MTAIYPTLKIAFVVITLVLPDGKLKTTAQTFKNTECRPLSQIFVPALAARTKQFARRGRIIKPAELRDWSYTCKEFSPGQNS